MKCTKHNYLSINPKIGIVKTIEIVCLFLVSTYQTFSATYTSVNSNIKRANWNSSSTWQSGIVPPTSGFASNSNTNITYGTPFQSIVLGGNLTVDNNSNLTLNVSDTLIVKNFTVNSGSNITIHGILIVTGSLINNGGINDGSTNGRLIVIGNINNSGGAINNITAYVFGTYSAIGSGSYLHKSQANFNTDYSTSTSIYKTVQQSSGIVSLPIELLSFSAQQSNETVHLGWKTATETNNDYFTLQRSIDGVDWSDIYTRSGVGTTTIEHFYSYIDNETSSNQIVYYRLIQTDYDGNFTFSDVISVSPQQEVYSFSVFPNPTSGNVTISIDNSLQALATIAIINEWGENIYNSNIFQSVIPFSDTPNGIYYVKITIGSRVIIKPVIVQK
jgi:hypothetical protein